MASSQLNLSRARYFLLSGSLFIFAAALRLYGIEFGLPYLYHADEPIVVNHALQYASMDFNPHFFNIPPLASYILFWGYGCLFVTLRAAGWILSAAQFESIFFNDPTLFYLFGRIFLGVLPALLGIFTLMKWLKKSGAGQDTVWVAGLLLAVCFIHVSDSHYIYTDLLLSLIGTLFFLVLHRLKWDILQSHFVIGLLIGAATAAKYNGIFFIIPYLWIILRTHLKASNRLLGLSIAGVGILAAFFILNPFSVLDFYFFRSELGEQSRANQGVSFLHHLVYSLNEGMSLPLIVLSLIGIIRAFLLRDFKRESVAIFCIFYYFVLWKKGQPFGRYVLLMVPFLIFHAVDAWSYLHSKGKLFRTFGACMVLASVVLNLEKDFRFCQIMHAGDVRTLASQWIEKNIPNGSSIAMQGTYFSPRLHFSCDQITEKITNLKTNVNFQGAQLRRLQEWRRRCLDWKGYHLQFLVNQKGLNPFTLASPEIEWNQMLMDPSIQFVAVTPDFISNPQVLAKLKQKAKLLKQFSPYRSFGVDSFKNDPQILTGGPFTSKDLIARQFNGYRIEIYEIKNN